MLHWFWHMAWKRFENTWWKQTSWSFTVTHCERAFCLKPFVTVITHDWSLEQGRQFLWVKLPKWPKCPKWPILSIWPNHEQFENCCYIVFVVLSVWQVLLYSSYHRTSVCLFKTIILRSLLYFSVWKVSKGEEKNIGVNVMVNLFTPEIRDTDFSTGPGTS